MTNTLWFATDDYRVAATILRSVDKAVTPYIIEQAIQSIARDIVDRVDNSFAGGYILPPDVLGQVRQLRRVAPGLEDLEVHFRYFTNLNGREFVRIQVGDETLAGKVFTVMNAMESVTFYGTQGLALIPSPADRDGNGIIGNWDRKLYPLAFNRTQRILEAINEHYPQNVRARRISEQLLAPVIAAARGLDIFAAQKLAEQNIADPLIEDMVACRLPFIDERLLTAGIPEGDQRTLIRGGIGVGDELSLTFVERDQTNTFTVGPS